MTPGSEPRHAALRRGGAVAEESSRTRRGGRRGTRPAPRRPEPEDDEEPLPVDERADRRAARRGARAHRVERAGARVRAAQRAARRRRRWAWTSSTALYWAIGGAVGSALAIGAYRLARKQPVRHAVNGLFGIAIGAFLAWRTGDAKDFYLPGILLTFGQAAVLLLSVAVRKPLIGYVWGVMANKGKHDWFGNPGCSAPSSG